MGRGTKKSHRGSQNAKPNRQRPLPVLRKSLTGIAGFDEVTSGGLPQGRPSLVCGKAGCGKTLLAMQFLVNGIREYDEPGVFVSFEEPEKDLIANVASLGFDLREMIRQKKLEIDHVRVVREEIAETGEYDLEGLFIRLGHAIKNIGAKRVVLDTLESLMGGLSNPAILRAELRRLFQWLKDQDVTAIITGEQGEGESLTRHGLEEYVSDCVILLDFRVQEQIATRRLRIVKYRGSSHGSNEYPFLIDESGITVLPITSLGLQHEVSDERVGTGIEHLDTMLGGGYLTGSSILVTGTAGAGKSSMGAHMVDAACRRGERALYFAFEESPAQIKRNMRSIGLDLAKWEKRGLLRFDAARPMAYGLEMHLVLMNKVLREFDPDVVVVDPISSLLRAGSRDDAHNMVVRLVDYLKVKHITAMFTSLTGGGESLEQTEIAVSSIVDTWLLLKTVELSGERNRAMYVLKSRGTAHSNQVREFLLTDEGVKLVEVYVGPEGVLTGTARIAQEAKEAAQIELQRNENEQRRRDAERRRAVMEAQIHALRAEIASEQEQVKHLLAQEKAAEQRVVAEREAMARMRGVGNASNSEQTNLPKSGRRKRSR